MKRRATPALATVFVVAALLGGCGQKGPLYLPDHPRQPAPAATPATTVPATAAPGQPTDPPGKKKPAPTAG